MSIRFSSSLVVTGAAQVVVAAVGGERPWRRKGLAVEPRLQDRFQASVAEGAHRERPLAGSLDAISAVAVAEAEDAEAGAEALFGMRPRFQDALGQLGGRGSRLLGPADDPARGPLLVPAVGVGHVGGVGGMASALVAANVAGDPAAAAEDLDRGRAEADLANLADELVGDRVVVAVDLQVVVNVDLGLLPDRELVAVRGERSQRRPLQFFEEALTGAWQL